MDNKKSVSQLIVRFEDTLEREPRSLVFAPLAENYRKIGLTDKALKVLKKGIRYNPDYVLGYMGLAGCYKDMQENHLAYSTLRPLISSCRENLKMQELFAEVCLSIGEEHEALDTFKYLLFLNPKNKKIIENVKKLEENAENVIIKSDDDDLGPIEFEIDNLISPEQTFDEQLNEWIQVDLNRENDLGKNEENNNEWKVESIENVENNFISTKDRNPKEIIDKTPKIKENSEEINVGNIPIMTHTLVDLYLNQGYPEKALEVLRKIEQLHPEDKATKDKIKDVELVLGDVMPSSNNLMNISKKESDITEEHGREALMSSFDKSFGEESQTEKVQIVENRLWHWHSELVKTAASKQSSNSDS